MCKLYSRDVERSYSLKESRLEDIFVMEACLQFGIIKMQTININIEHIYPKLVNLVYWRSWNKSKHTISTYKFVFIFKLKS